MAFYRDDHKFDVQLTTSEMEARGLVDMLTGDTIEHKCEHFQWWEFGNLFIETGQRRRPSGLLTTEAACWAHQLRRDGRLIVTLLFPVPILKEIVVANRANFKSGVGDGGRMSGVVLPIGPLRHWGA